MNFSEALAELNSGNSTKRMSWTTIHSVTIVQPDGKSKITLPFLCAMRPNFTSNLPDRFPWHPTAEDLFAEDWVASGYF